MSSKKNTNRSSSSSFVNADVFRRLFELKRKLWQNKSNLSVFLFLSSTICTCEILLNWLFFLLVLSFVLFHFLQLFSHLFFSFNYFGSNRKRNKIIQEKSKKPRKPTTDRRRMIGVLDDFSIVDLFSFILSIYV